jgi:thiol-disulfide isomerase/thioredoxin
MKTVHFSNSPENQLFYEYQNLISSKREIADKLLEIKKKSESVHQKDSITKIIDNISEEVTSYTQKIIHDNPAMSFAVFLKALQDIKVPDPPKDAQGKVTDSAFQYRYYLKHYFDNFNFADDRLLRTPIYEQKVKNYINKVVPQMPDSLNKAIDMLLGLSQKDEEVFRYLLVTLFNEYASSQIMGMDAVLVHIAEKWYLPYATWSDNDFKEKLKKEIAKKKPNQLGNIAPDLKLVQVPNEHFLVAKTDTALKSNPYVGSPLNLHDIPAKFLVVIFWEADCGHCKKAVPLLYDSVYPLIKDKGAKILAIHMIASVEGKRKWIDFVNEHQLYDWINAWSPYSYEYKDLYDVYSTPVIYVLDANKRILAKRIGPEQIEDIINFELKKEKNKL